MFQTYFSFVKTSKICLGVNLVGYQDHISEGQQVSLPQNSYNVSISLHARSFSNGSLHHISATSVCGQQDGCKS